MCFRFKDEHTFGLSPPSWTGKKRHVELSAVQRPRKREMEYLLSLLPLSLSLPRQYTEPVCLSLHTRRGETANYREAGEKQLSPPPSSFQWQRPIKRGMEYSLSLLPHNRPSLYGSIYSQDGERLCKLSWKSEKNKCSPPPSSFHWRQEITTGSPASSAVRNESAAVCTLLNNSRINWKIVG